MERIRRSLTFANVAAGLALAISLGLGSAWAADQIGSQQIQNGSVDTQDLAGNAVTSKKVDDGSLKPGDLSESVSTGAFAYVAQPVSGGPATLIYGEGAKSVREIGTGNYVVTFRRDLSNCVAQAAPGFGDPPGQSVASVVNSLSTVSISGNEVEAAFTNQSEAPVETSFLMSVMC